MGLLVISEFCFFQEELFTGEGFDFVLIVGKVQAGVPGKVPFLDIDGADCQVYTYILCFSDVAYHVAVTGRTGDT